MQDYSTYGPTDTETWHDYFHRLREDRLEDVHVQRDIVVLRSGHEITPEVLRHLGCRSLTGFVKLARDHDWHTKVGYSKSYNPGHYLSSGDNAGEWQVGYVLEQTWLAAGKPGRPVLDILFSRRNGGSWICIHRHRRGYNEVVGDAVMKRYMRVF